LANRIAIMQAAEVALGTASSAAESPGADHQCAYEIASEDADVAHDSLMHWLPADAAEVAAKGQALLSIGRDLASVAVVLTADAAALGTDETALLAMSRDFERIMPMWEARSRFHNESAEAAHKKARAAAGGAFSEEHIKKAERDYGIYSVRAAWEPICERVADLTERASAIPAATVAGVVAKAKITAHHHEPTTDLDMRLEDGVLQSLLRDVLALGVA